jgi:predicted esterase YcpF (UPF0227 family)
MKPTLLYIHGLGSDRHSRKFVDLKNYFGDKFLFEFIEWNIRSDISALLAVAELKLKSAHRAILIGDSTGANFAHQLREKMKQSGKESLLILTSPLLDLGDRIADFEFPESLIPQLIKIEHPEDALIIASLKDEIINQKPLFEKPLKAVRLIRVDDNHRLMKFQNYMPEIEHYILSKLL